MPRINLLFTLIILLTACTPYATPAPLPTVTSSPVVTETAAIDITPAGFDMAPTDSSNSSSELFVLPTTEDAKIYTSGEAEIPKNIKDVVALYKKEMEKLIPEVAEVCVVPAADMKLVFKEGTVGGQFRWTIVYEAGKYTCWSTVESTGQLREYPSYFDKTGRIKGHADRVSWERLEGKMGWAGTVAVLLSNSGYIIPEGFNGSAINTPDNWSVLEAKAGEAVSLIPNPISSENMNLLNSAGYRWDAATGSLKNVDGYTALTFQNRKWVDQRTGAENAVEDLQLVPVNGVDFQGHNIVVMLTMKMFGEDSIRFYNPIIDAWVEPVDVLRSQQVIDRPDLPKATREQYRDIDSVVLENLPKITWDDFHSGRLFYSEILALKPWPENVIVPELQYARLSMVTNVWVLTEYSTADPGDDRIMLDLGRPVLEVTDGIRNLSAFWMKDPITGKPMIVQGLQYLYKGKTAVLHVFFSDELANINSGETFLVKSSLNNPPSRVTMPIVNIRPEDYCGKGGLGGFLPAPGICALQGYDNLDLPRTVLPIELQNMISKYDTGIQLTGLATDTYPAGDEIYRLQQLPLPQNTFFQRQLGWYLLPLDSPFLKP